MRPVLKSLLTEPMKKNKGVKFWVSVHIEYSHPHREIHPHMDPPYLHTGTQTLIDPSGLEQKLDDVENAVLTKNANFVRQSSGLVVEDILDFRFRVSKYNPLAARGFQQLPKFLKNKHAIVNIQNQDNRCFGYSVIAALENIDWRAHAYRPEQYDGLFEQYELNDLEYPVAIEQIPAIEDRLQTQINVFSFFDDEGRGRFPMYVSKKEFNKSIDLLYWDEHYAWIKNFSFFMGDKGKKHTQYWCKGCLGHFWRLKTLETHKLWCRGMDGAGQIFITPEPWWKVKFANEAFIHRAPIVVYADFEAFINPTGNTHPNRGHKTFEYELQTPCSVGWKIISVVPQFERDYQSKVGDDCVEFFLARMHEFAEEAIKFLWDETRMIITPEQQQAFDISWTCHLCNKPIDPQNDKNKKVRDHDHVTGLYIGPAHNSCNLRAKQTYKIPIFFHNFRGYDGHFITRALKNYGAQKISVIGQGMEKYLMLSIGNLAFKDSLMFLGASLQSLADNLLKGGIENFKHFRNLYPFMPRNQLALLLRKGVYPYEYMDSMEKFDAAHLPPIAEFYSRLQDKDIDLGDYAHASLVWETFHCHSMLDYHNLYLMSMSIFYFLLIVIISSL